jgi:hypothetical protein
MKTIIDVVQVADKEAMMKQQTKINQWRTTGLFVDMQISTTDRYIVFVITRHKEAPISMPYSPEQLIKEFDDAEAEHTGLCPGCSCRDCVCDIAPF